VVLFGRVNGLGDVGGAEGYQLAAA
jgi:hypothetical protein